MKEARIRTSFGEICIGFQTTEELNNAIQNLDQEIKIIQEAVEKVTPPNQREPKPGCENIYRFIESGNVELLRMPDKARDAVALVLFAYSPELASSTQIERATTIKDVSSNVISTGSNKNYFQRVGDKYGLKIDGRKLVTETILPSLLVSNPANQTNREKTE